MNWTELDWTAESLASYSHAMWWKWTELTTLQLSSVCLLCTVFCCNWTELRFQFSSFLWTETGMGKLFSP